MNLQGRHQPPLREKAPPPPDAGTRFVARGPTERPGSIREAIIRWLNEEL